MSLDLAVWLTRVAYVYVAIGTLLVPWWHRRGLRRLDRTTLHGTWGFRVLITPGLIALWPWLFARAARGTGEPAAECNAHRKLARGNITS